MSRVVIQESVQQFYPSVFEGLGRIELNYHELQCLHLAIYYLKLQLSKSQCHSPWTNLRDYHTRNIEHWLNRSGLKRELRFDGNNSVAWPVLSSEDVEWLLLALEVGINEDTIVDMSADEANYDRDMALMHVEDEKACALADTACSERFCSLVDYYCQIANCSNTLLSKLRQVMNDV